MAHRRHHRVASVLVVCAVAIALALGAIGGASAAGLTKKAVRKIATKVVKRQASSLSVAHASSSDAVGGHTADQLQTTEYRYTITPLPPKGVVFYRFPGLPGGSYQVSYWYNASTSIPNAQLSCEITASPTDDPVAQSYSVSSNSANQARGSATGGLTVTTGPVTFACIPDGNVVVSGQISFVRVDKVVAGLTSAS